MGEQGDAFSAELDDDLDTDDVGQKRYVMFLIFDSLLDSFYDVSDRQVEDENKVAELKEFDGYMYKLSQEFLTSSSTFEKEQKLEKMIDHLERKS
ncbi:MAG: hypothetical protein ABEI58_02190 [Candidatus Nanohaloarchaea archaeon]